jgi:hypothetical protein
MADEPRVQQLIDEIFASNRTPKRSAAIAPNRCPRFAGAGGRCAFSTRTSMRCFRLDEKRPTLMPPLAGDPGTGLPQVPGYEVEAVLVAAAWVSFTGPGIWPSSAPSRSR